MPGALWNRRERIFDPTAEPMKRTSRLLLKTADSLAFLAQKIRGGARKAAVEAALSLDDCERCNWENVRPCFVLSTGRCGTLMLTNLLLTSKNAFPVHQPRPELVRASKLAYENISRTPELYREVFKSAREEYLLEAAQRQQVFIETNNRITFFAPIIRDVFPNAVFIHLVRHPGDFVRSGMRRGWYTGGHDHDIGRITPVNTAPLVKWQQASRIEKIAWLWNETNSFVEQLKRRLHSEQTLTVKAEDLFSEPSTLKRIFLFLQLRGFDRKTVHAMLARPANAQRKGSFPSYLDWSDKDKHKLKEWVPLASQYSYVL